VALSAEQARLADEALRRVRAAATSARSALDNESVTLVWLTGSSSARAAREESLRQTTKILADLENRRPGLTSDKLTGFVELASAGAEVSALLESARRMTAEGFKREVVDPTARDLNPFNLDGKVGKALLVAGLVLVVVLVLK
jgi:hypothetical protein